MVLYQGKGILFITDGGYEIAHRVPRKTSFASFPRYPAGLVYWGKGYKSNDLRYKQSCPFPQPPIPFQVLSRFPIVIAEAFGDAAPPKQPAQARRSHTVASRRVKRAPGY